MARMTDIIDIEPDRGVPIVAVGRASWDVRDGLWTPGGSARNVAETAARLGADSRLVGNVGKDPRGHKLMALLQELGINVDGVHMLDDESTSTIYQSDRGSADVSLRYDTSAAELLSKDRVCEAIGKTGVQSIVHFAGTLRIPGLFADTFHFEETLDTLANHGHIIAMDPGRLPDSPEDPEEPDLLNRAVTFFQHDQNLGRLDIFMPNLGEAIALLGHDEPEPTERLKVLDLAKRLSERALKDGTRVVIIKLGHHGIYAASHEGEADVVVPPLSGDRRKTTVGLGDSTNGGIHVAMTSVLGELRESGRGPGDLADGELKRIIGHGALVSTTRMQKGVYPSRNELREVHDEHSGGYFRTDWLL